MWKTFKNLRLNDTFCFFSLSLSLRERMIHSSVFNSTMNLCAIRIKYFMTDNMTRVRLFSFDKM